MRLIPFSMFLLALLLGGCISSAPIVPVTPANSAQVTTCQSDASLHNGIVVGDFVIGGLTSGLASTAAGLTNATAKNDISVAAAAAGGLTIAGAALAGYTAANFANSNCSSVVGSLPPDLVTAVPKPLPPNSPANTVKDPQAH